MKTSESTKNINKALFKFQGIMPNIKRNGTNDHFNSKYITYDDLVDAVIPYLQQCGLLLEQETGIVDGYVTVSTRITHVESDEFKQYEPYRILEAKSGNLDHNAGRSTTYAQKRSLILALALRGTDEDTDGNNPEQPPKKDRPTQPQSFSKGRNDKDHRIAQVRFIKMCKEKGMSDELRHAVTFEIMKKSSTTDLTAKELEYIHSLIVNKPLHNMKSWFEQKCG